MLEIIPTLEKLQIEALVETFEEQAGMPLLRERLAALREEEHDAVRSTMSIMYKYFTFPAIILCIFST